MEISKHYIQIHSYSFRGKNGRLSRDADTVRDLVLPEYLDGNVLRILGKNIFYSQNLNTVKLPPELQIIEDGAFMNNELTEIIIPKKVRFIGYLTFADNPLIKIVLPPSLEYIDDEAFVGAVNPVLICQVNSYAHTFAEGHGYERKILSEEEFNLHYNL